MLGLRSAQTCFNNCQYAGPLKDIIKAVGFTMDSQMEDERANLIGTTT